VEVLGLVNRSAQHDEGKGNVTSCCASAACENGRNCRSRIFLLFSHVLPLFWTVAVERHAELAKIGMPNAINQLASTIRAIRAGKVTAPSMPSFDWTMTPILPVIVTEERMPQVPGCWDAFYGEMSEPLDELAGAGPLSKLRMLNIDDVETIADLESSDDLGAMFMRWGADSTVTELPFRSFMATQDARLRRRFVPDRYWETMQFLARRLGLDERMVERPDGPEVGDSHRPGGHRDDAHRARP